MPDLARLTATGRWRSRGGSASGGNDGNTSTMKTRPKPPLPMSLCSSKPPVASVSSAGVRATAAGAATALAGTPVAIGGGGLASSSERFARPLICISTACARRSFWLSFLRLFCSRSRSTLTSSNTLSLARPQCSSSAAARASYCK
eukprot:6058765-Prymnesium_polylepis.1